MKTKIASLLVAAAMFAGIGAGVTSSTPSAEAGGCEWVSTRVVVDAHYEWRWSSWRGFYQVYVPYSTYWHTECVYT